MKNQGFTLVCAGVFLLLTVVMMVVTTHRVIEVVITPDMINHPCTGSYDPSIDGKLEYWDETANALGISPQELTIEVYLDHSKIKTVKEMRAWMLEWNDRGLE